MNQAQSLACYQQFCFVPEDTSLPQSEPAAAPAIIALVSVNTHQGKGKLQGLPLHCNSLYLEPLWDRLLCRALP